MATGAVPPTGRERRRKGPINRLRRLMYGLLLLAAAPGVVVGDELAHFGKYHGLPVAESPERFALVTLQGLLVLRAGETDRPEITLDAVTAQVPQSGAAQAPQFRVAAARRRASSDATDFDLPVTDFGEFHLSLLAQPSAALSAWSLGGTLELVRAGGARLVAAVPELRILDMHGSEARFIPFEAALKRKRTPDAVLSFRWRI